MTGRVYYATYYDMAALPGVTRADGSLGGGARPHVTWPRPLCVLCLLLAIGIPWPASAQTRSRDDTTAGMPHGPGEEVGPSAVSLQRIQRALALRRTTEHPSFDGLDVVDEVRRRDWRPILQLMPGLTFVGGADPFSFLDATTGPVPMGGPTHRAMMHVMTPRELREATSTDVLGIATASAFSLVPYVVKGIGAIAKWLFGDDDDGAPDHPVLTLSEEALALAGAKADDLVLDADVVQRGRTVGLSLVVPADTPPDTARVLGTRFLTQVKRLASTEPDPDSQIGAGDYDYIVRVSSPTETVIALGGKATSHTTISW